MNNNKVFCPPPAPCESITQNDIDQYNKIFGVSKRERFVSKPIRVQYRYLRLKVKRKVLWG